MIHILTIFEKCDFTVKKVGYWKHRYEWCLATWCGLRKGTNRDCTCLDNIAVNRKVMRFWDFNFSHVLHFLFSLPYPKGRSDKCRCFCIIIYHKKEIYSQISKFNLHHTTHHLCSVVTIAARHKPKPEVYNIKLFFQFNFMQTCS